MSNGTADPFKVDLLQYRGPMDLLLYLVRRHEVEVGDLKLHKIAEQFLEHVDSIQEVDINLKFFIEGFVKVQDTSTKPRFVFCFNSD